MWVTSSLILCNQAKGMLISVPVPKCPEKSTFDYMTNNTCNSFTIYLKPRNNMLLAWEFILSFFFFFNLISLSFFSFSDISQFHNLHTWHLHMLRSVQSQRSKFFCQSCIFSCSVSVSFPAQYSVGERNQSILCLSVYTISKCPLKRKKHHCKLGNCMILFIRESSLKPPMDLLCKSLFPWTF